MGEKPGHSAPPMNTRFNIGLMGVEWREWAQKLAVPLLKWRASATAVWYCTLKILIPKDLYGCPPSCAATDAGIGTLHIGVENKCLVSAAVLRIPANWMAGVSPAVL